MNKNETELVLDNDVRAVMEFMQQKIPAEKLLGVAESLPGLARLLWVKFQQEPVQAVSLVLTKQHPLRSNASECGLALPCVGDGSAEAEGVQ